LSLSRSCFPLSGFGGAFVSLAVGSLGDRFGLRASMGLLFVTLGYILSVGFWAKPLVSNATVPWRELFRPRRRDLDQAAAS